MESLTSNVAEISVKISNLEKELKKHQNPGTETYNVSTEDFKCEKCGVAYNNKKVTLRKHINTKHQLNSVKTSCNEKEHKIAKQPLKDLNDKVEYLSLRKARAECEVGRLKA